MVLNGVSQNIGIYEVMLQKFLKTHLIPKPIHNLPDPWCHFLAKKTQNKQNPHVLF